MDKPLQLDTAAGFGHALALELYRFTARWPECEREGLTLEVRRTGWSLSSCLDEANEGLRDRALKRAVDNARRICAVGVPPTPATDLGYRKFSSGSMVDEIMAHLDIELGILAWAA